MRVLEGKQNFEIMEETRKKEIWLMNGSLKDCNEPWLSINQMITNEYLLINLTFT